MGSFSEPREGIHSLRILDIAIVDVFLTVIVALFISKKYFLSIFIALILLSIVMHTLLGIKTKTNSWLFS
jgi:hypothetical protein